jgi:spore coat polysaccharide biosynthesis protein SpsF (cytidylyltransferase family)
MGSSRLPGKSMKKLGDRLLIDHVIRRASLTILDDLFLATTTLPEDDILANYVRDNYEISIFRGNPTDVRSRFLEIAKQSGADLVARVTADDPFKDPSFLAKGFEKISDHDYYCNFSPAVYPVGMDIEIFKAESLIKSTEIYGDEYNREHVTPCFRSDERFSFISDDRIPTDTDIRLTVDTQEDFDFCSKIANYLSNNMPDNLSYSATSKAMKSIDH